MSEQETKKLNAILYTDGGYRSQYQAGGWGIHGYTYAETPPDKGTGNSKCIPTAKGYVDPEEKATATLVTLESYIDGVGGVAPAHSSNQTELTATIKGMEYILERQFAHSQIYSDSMYVIDGVNRFIDRWQKNGWKNAEGETISNKRLWERALGLMETLTEKRQTLEVLWIRGHNGNFGNEQADGYARRGNVLGRKKSEYTFIKETPAQGYWNKKADFNRLLSCGRWYFQTTDDDYMTADGKTIYYIGDHGDAEAPGKRNADNALTVLYLKESDLVLELLRSQARDLDTRRIGSVMIGRLDTILNPSFYTEVLSHGTLFLDWTERRKDVFTASKKPVLEEQSPPGLSFIQIETLQSLQRKLDGYLAQDPGIFVTEITDLLYDLEDKKTGPVKKIKKDLTQSTRYLDVKARYCTAPVKDIAAGHAIKIEQKTIRLIMGMDLARRNTLSNIANDEVKVSVVTWRESEQVIRFATVIETKHGVGIWSGIDANYLMVQ